ncbi:hypothetical protein [Phreatobacter cathodiphilus]|uniref:Uncharacterized protein n=1 Tax=Phreatobacter cathodiphilus TaxID=1868589 RepID=A0A2S0N914_9HYPH|nr:hypothetical protein [Phreatobacter cathodiphilus]AVO44507.1 hypothetical protein C6569_05195 [Phreatobacter cathodiphilus]
MRIFGWALLWAVIGLVGGFLAAVAIGLVLFEVFDVSQREGAAAMGLVFVIGPFVACLTALATGATAAVVTRRRELRREGGDVAPRQPAPRGVRAAIGGGLGLVGGYGAAVLGLFAFYQLRGTPYFTSYGWALAASWAPFVTAAAGCGLGLWVALRDRGPAAGVSG